MLGILEYHSNTIDLQRSVTLSKFCHIWDKVTVHQTPEQIQYALCKSIPHKQERGTYA